MVDRHTLFRVPRNHLCHCLIDAACTQTAAEGQDAHSVIKAQLFPGCGSVHAGDAATHRESGDGIGTVRVEIIQRLFHGEHHVIDFLCQHLIGNAGECVLLVNGAGNAHMRRSVENRSCHIAACADGNVRLELFQDLLGTVLGCCQIIRRPAVPLDVLPVQLALKSGNVHGLQGIACRRDKASLHAVRRSHKEELCRGVMLFDNGCNGERRVDMTARAAACQ